MGFPAYGRGPFERYGLPTTVPLLLGFLALCLLECLAVWSGAASGAAPSLRCCFCRQVRCAGGPSRSHSGRASPCALSAGA